MNAGKTIRRLSQTETFKAMKADMSKVLAALGAVGAPATLDMIGEGMKAVKDRQTA